MPSRRSQQAEALKPKPPTSGPGEPNDQGIYRVGAGIQPPPRLDRAVYPPEDGCGNEGNVVAEVVSGWRSP